MSPQVVRFGVEVARETDIAVEKLAEVEGRPSKRNMHAVLLNRFVRLWKEHPDKAIELGLVKPERRVNG